MCIRDSSLEEISEKLEMFHNYEDEIAAANQEYNNSQMFHVMDEAEEHGEDVYKRQGVYGYFLKGRNGEDGV